MATAFTATSSTLIVDTFSSRNSVAITNTGAGTLLVLIGANASTDPTVSATDYTVSIPSGAYWESPPGVVGRYFGIMLTAGTAYWTQAANRLN